MRPRGGRGGGNLGGRAMNYHSPAPMGHPVKARGNALGTSPKTFPSPERAASSSLGSAPSGRESLCRWNPGRCPGLSHVAPLGLHRIRCSFGALPWAIACRPVGAMVLRPIGAMAVRRVAAMNHDSPAPTGHPVKALGNALGTSPKTFPSPERAASSSLGSAPSGRESLCRWNPGRCPGLSHVAPLGLHRIRCSFGALPWAIACRPVGAMVLRPIGAMAVRRVAAMNHDSPAPTGHPVKALGNALGMSPHIFPSPERA